MLEEVETAQHFLLNLLRRAEDMSIVLLETTYANKTTKGARNFISVQHAKVSIAERQISVAVDAMFKHNAVSRAVHWLGSLASFVTLE